MQTGFTLIELIIVIVILGILSVIAAPRFIDISESASDASWNTLKATFESSVKLLYAKNELNGGGEIVDLDVYGTGSGTGLNFNSFGYPVNTRENNDWTFVSGYGCGALFDKIIDSSDFIADPSSPDRTILAGMLAVASGTPACTYSFAEDTSVWFIYYVETGEIVHGW
jgi:prepilin-type N-terminal cleavage/methylation domain-containing protein